MWLSLGINLCKKQIPVFYLHVVVIKNLLCYNLTGSTHSKLYFRSAFTVSYTVRLQMGSNYSSGSESSLYSWIYFSSRTLHK
jgi:hypothetical protein